VGADLRGICQTRLREAKLLFREGEYSGAYYLAGYVIECAFKVCITKGFKKYEMPDKKLVSDSHTHNLELLAKLAGLDGALAQEGTNDPDFQINWNLIRDWTEAARYRYWTKGDAEEILKAIGDRNHGVLRWIKQHW
jgi:hypothetical protein